MIFDLIAAEKANHTVKQMTRLLGVPRSSYYYVLAQSAAPPSARRLRCAAIDAAVAKSHDESDGTYGAPRVRADLQDWGFAVSRKTIAKSMQKQSLQGIRPGVFKVVTTEADPAAAPLPDLVGRVWDTGELDRVWTSDITYLRTGEGWLYLCAVRDGCSRKVIGWALRDHLRTELVAEAVKMANAFRTRRSGRVVLHADRGTQYTSHEIRDYAADNAIDLSVGRTGVCWDNAQQESFWSTLKSEFYDRHQWPTRRAAATAVINWIEGFYNIRRRHSKLAMLSPVEFEHRQRLSVAA